MDDTDGLYELLQAKTGLRVLVGLEGLAGRAPPEPSNPSFDIREVSFITGAGALYLRQGPNFWGYSKRSINFWGCKKIFSGVQEG